MRKRMKKGEVGEAAMYVSRKVACRKLQLSLMQFVRLCILKGVYPRKPKSYAKAQKGDSNIRMLYLKTDIKYLSQEPIIWKFREEKVHRKKLRSLKSQKEYKEFFRQKLREPNFSVQHIIRERYPTFQRALEDLDDTLSTIFLYRALPINKGPDPKLVTLSDRFATEFLHFLTESRALRKAFITYQGYYYRAHIHGCRVTWMVPHPFPVTNTDIKHVRIMTTFVKFYATFLGFVNFKLYSSLGLIYPPVLPKGKGDDRLNFDDKTFALCSLGLSIKKDKDSPISRELPHAVEFLLHLNEKNPRRGQPQEEEEEEKKSRVQMTLFQGIKFFLGRETNRESLALVIRCAGGMVSWDRTLGLGATYDEDDLEIKYQIVDRPKIDVKHISRYYVQPQWVYDSFNAALLLPVQQYFVGATLPAHLSPFEETHHQLYEPPEMVRLKALQERVVLVGDKAAPAPAPVPAQGEEGPGPVVEEGVDFCDFGDDDDEDEDGGGEEEELNKEVEECSSVVQPELAHFRPPATGNKGRRKKQWWKRRTLGSRAPQEEEGDGEGGEAAGGLLKGMRVSRGAPYVRRLDPEVKSKQGELQQLTAGFIHRKQRWLYGQARRREAGQRAWADLYKTRRQAYEREMARRTRLQKATKQRDQLKKKGLRRQGQDSSNSQPATEAAQS